MKLAAEIEMPFSEFWEMTPYELNLVAEAYFSRRKETYKEKLSLEYYNALWTIKWLGKKRDHPRPLKKILKDLDKEKKIMTEDQMLNQAKILNVIFGGDVDTCNP